MAKRLPIPIVRIADAAVRPGERMRIELPVARLATGAEMTLPVEVVNGVKPGPRLWISAAIHGDELNGIEIIHRILDKVRPATLRGELIVVPVVNVFGFIERDRYLPDRRDLNRCFPGSDRGSLASRLAHLFMTQIVAHCTHGLDLHTASNHRTNLPQVRANLDHAPTRELAEAFGAPIMIHGDAPPGSLRHAVAKQGAPILVYEAGEPQRFNKDAIDIGVKGALRVMSLLGMIRQKRAQVNRQCMASRSRTWVRARRSGLLSLQVSLGQWVSKGDSVGVVRDAFGDERTDVSSPANGLVIGHTNNPLVHAGDAILHLATDVATQHQV